MTQASMKALRPDQNYFFVIFFYLDFTFIYNPLAYDRLLVFYLYIKNPTWPLPFTILFLPYFAVLFHGFFVNT